MIEACDRGADIAVVTARLPGSVDEYEDSPDDARLAVAIATERLSKLPQARRQMVIIAAGNLALAVLWLVSGIKVLGLPAFAVVVAAVAIGLPTVGLVRTRLERSLELNRRIAGEER